MGRSKQPEGKTRELEYLRAEIKRLKRIIKDLEKNAHNYVNYKDMYTVELEPKEELPKTNVCQECFKGELKTIDLGIRVITECQTCGDRRSNRGKTEES